MVLLLFLTPHGELNNFGVLLTRECVVNITLYWAFTHFVQLPLSQKINKPALCSNEDVSSFKSACH